MDGDSLKDIIGTAPLPDSYHFDPDTDPDSKGDFTFMLVLQPGTDPNDARERLNDKTDEIGFGNYLSIARTIVCYTIPDVFEDFWGCELEHEPSMAGEIGYTLGGYKQITPTQVPDDLADIIKNAHLNCRRV